MGAFIIKLFLLLLLLFVYKTRSRKNNLDVSGIAAMKIMV